MVDDAGTRYLVYRFKTTAAESWSDRRTSVDLLDRNGLDQLLVTPTIHTANPVPVFWRQSATSTSRAAMIWCSAWGSMM